MKRRVLDRPGPSYLTDLQSSIDPDRVYAKGPEASEKPVREEVRILSWNVGYGHEPNRLAEVIRSIDPDIACLQEVDWGNRRTGSTDVLQELAEEVGLHGLFATEFFEFDSPLRPGHLAGGGVTGNALLTRFEPTSVFKLDLPSCVDWRPDADHSNLPWLVRQRLRHEPRDGERSGICAELVLNGKKLSIVSVHLEDKAGGVGGRWEQYLAAEKTLREQQPPADVRVIAGDFNTFDCRLARLISCDDDSTTLNKPRGLPEAAWWKDQLLPRTGFADPFSATCWTFQVPPLFRAKLDWLTTDSKKIRATGVGPLVSSDHRPIWVDLDLS